jgi:hypothetical protein
MYDSVVPARIPPGVTMVACYIDGRYAIDPLKAQQLHPHAIIVMIATRASTNAGDVLDVERGDATPTLAPMWCRMRRAAGQDPTVYCSLDTWPLVKAAFATAGEPEPYYWIAAVPGGGPVLLPGAVAHQYAFSVDWDVSVVADYWPGVDPPPSGSPATGSHLEGTTTTTGGVRMQVFEAYGQLHTITVDPAGIVVHRFYDPPDPGTHTGHTATWSREILGRGGIPTTPVGVALDYDGALHYFCDLPDGRQLHGWYSPSTGWATETLP